MDMPIKRFDAEKAIRQVEEKAKIFAKLTAPQCK
jgi:hypothetical protein